MKFKIVAFVFITALLTVCATAENGAEREQSGIIVYYKHDFEKGPEGFQGTKGTSLDTAPGVSGKALKAVIRKRWGGPALGINIQGSRGLKLAFIAKGLGMGRATLNVWDAKARDNTTPYGYRVLPDGEWRPVFYHLDRFRYNSKGSGFVKNDTDYRNVRFWAREIKGKEAILLLDNFVIYRGDDPSPPKRVEGLKAKAAPEGIALEWNEPHDNAFPMLYVVERADQGGAYEKIAETVETRFLDRTAGKGTLRYRVLACDFENNLGPWSDPVEVTGMAPRATRQLSREEKDRIIYAEHIRRIHGHGTGKVNKGLVTLYGDSLTYATVYRHEVAAHLGIYRVEARGFPGMTTGWGRRHVMEKALAKDNPEFLLVLFGTNNVLGRKHSRDEMEKWADDLEAIVKAGEARGTVVILGTIPPRGFSDPESRPEREYNQVVIERARKLKVPVAYIFDEIQAGGDRRQYIWRDGVHWTPKGMEAAARAWERTMRQVEFALRFRE